MERDEIKYVSRSFSDLLEKYRALEEPEASLLYQASLWISDQYGDRLQPYDLIIPHIGRHDEGVHLFHLTDDPYKARNLSYGYRKALRLPSLEKLYSQHCTRDFYYVAISDARDADPNFCHYTGCLDHQFLKILTQSTLQFLSEK